MRGLTDTGCGALSLILSILVGGATSGQACTVPVFRYAMDHWPADMYELRAPTSESLDDATLLNPFRDHPAINWRIREEETLDSSAQLLSPFPGDPLLWEGSLDRESLDRLVDSPARQAVLEGLLEGDSTVWVVVGDTDGSFAARIQNRLDYLEQVVEIPPQDPLDPENKLGPGPALKVGFSVVSVDYEDPKESAFIAMLAGPKRERLLESKTPFASPVFGRGRALDAWTAEELDDVGIDDACIFLISACSCQVKDQNPGWDLLLHCYWEKELIEADDRRLAMGQPETSEPTVYTPPAPETVTFAPEAPAASSETEETESEPWTSVGILIALAAAGVVFLFRAKKG